MKLASTLLLWGQNNAPIQDPDALLAIATRGILDHRKLVRRVDDKATIYSNGEVEIRYSSGSYGTSVYLEYGRDVGLKEITLHQARVKAIDLIKRIWDRPWQMQASGRAGSYQFRFAPTYQGVPFTQKFYVSLDIFGRPTRLSIPTQPLPLPPKDAVPAFGPERAQAIAAIATIKHYGHIPLRTVTETRCAIATPPTDWIGSEVALDSNRGRTTYFVKFGPGAEGSIHTSVDAVTGQVVAISSGMQYPPLGPVSSFDFPATIEGTEVWTRQVALKRLVSLKITPTPAIFIPMSEVVLVTEEHLLLFEIGFDNLAKLTIGNETFFYETAQGTHLAVKPRIAMPLQTRTPSS